MSAPSAPSKRQAVAPHRPRSLRGWLTAGLTILIALALLIPIGAVMQIVLSAQFDDRSKTQAIVLMDPSRFWGDGAEVLASRVGHAAELYHQKVAPVIMLTGKDSTTSAERTLLVASGVPARDIVSFTTGVDTLGSLEMIAAVMNDLHWQSATIVTDPPNAARASAIASGYGIDAHLSPAKSGPGTALTSDYVGRETAALMRYYLLTRWTQPQLVHPVD
ncbi:MAG: YdcF family protein [Candidatus Nanopelagicales bacterium]